MVKRLIRIVILLMIAILAVYAQENEIPDTVEVRRVDVAMFDEPTIENIVFRIENGELIVTYDLFSRDIDHFYEISFLVSVVSDGINNYRPKQVRGDIGDGISIGRGKRIVWEYTREMGNHINTDEIEVSILIQGDAKRRFSFSALTRSAVIPGWGQRYDNSKTKGSLFICGAIAAGAALTFLHFDYINTNENYNDAINAYNNADTPQAAIDARAKIMENYDKLSRAVDNRNIAIYAAAGLYALNILDALLFHSRRSIELYQGQHGKLELQPNVIFHNNGAAAGLSFIF